MPKPYTVIVGKTVRHISRLRGGGSALPGLVVEKIDPSFVAKTLSNLPYGVVVVSGTNGKTTTTKIVVELLESQGLKVFTNKTGSNFVRGVAAALLAEVNLRGKLSADIAVLELDEAHAVLFAKTVQPRYSLFLNVLRDQLDRFGEIDKTAQLLHTVAKYTSSNVIVNYDDPRLNSDKFLDGLTAEVSSFGASDDLLDLFPSDDDLHTQTSRTKTTSIVPEPVARLEAVEKNHATITMGDDQHIVELSLSGLYNTLNAVAAVALCRVVLGEKLNHGNLFRKLADVEPAFGRGEKLTIDGQPCELVLVKNPSGFRLGLQSFDPTEHATMIAINDNYADGRDMSWLWDVDFSSLRSGGVAEVSGVRAYDMALRLHYDDVETPNIHEDIRLAIKHFLANSSGQPKRIFCTYTAMLAIRKILAKHTKMERVL